MAMMVVVNLAIVAFFITAASSQKSPAAYTNRTVGGNAGWFFNTASNTSSTDYSKWAASQTFNLGDYLIFNTNTNQTVIQSYNETTYRSCSTDDASDDTFHYGGGPEIGKPSTVALPLTREGPNYYFSDANDGFPCRHGMAFEIEVKHGLGLPPSLNQPPPPPYSQPPTTLPADSSQSPPGTSDQQQEIYRGVGVRRGANVRMAVFMVLVGGYLSLV